MSLGLQVSGGASEHMTASRVILDEFLDSYFLEPNYAFLYFMGPR